MLCHNENLKNNRSYHITESAHRKTKNAPGKLGALFIFIFVFTDYGAVAVTGDSIWVLFPESSVTNGVTASSCGTSFTGVPVGTMIGSLFGTVSIGIGGAITSTDTGIVFASEYEVFAPFTAIATQLKDNSRGAF